MTLLFFSGWQYSVNHIRKLNRKKLFSETLRASQSPSIPRLYQSGSPEAYTPGPQQFSPFKISFSDSLLLDVMPAATRKDHKSTFAGAVKLLVGQCNINKSTSYK